MSFDAHFHIVDPRSPLVPFRPSDIDLVREALGPEAHRALWQNPRDFYRMTASADRKDHP